MPATKTSAVKLPYSQQFSPNQTPLDRLLAILRVNGGKPSLIKAIASAFFKSKAAPEKLAGNTIAALHSYGILAVDNTIAPFGAELLAYQGKEQDAHKLLARRLLLDFNAVTIVEALREMTEGGHNIDLPNLTDELQRRGVELTKNSSDLSSILGWLRAGGVLKNYNVDKEAYRSLVGASVTTLDAFRKLTPEQIAFLRAMLALNIHDWTPYNSIIPHAETLYSGEVRYNWKEIVSTVLRPLERAGLIEIRKRTKADKSTPQGRGGKTADVKPTARFEKEVADPLLRVLFKGAGQVPNPRSFVLSAKPTNLLKM